MRRLLLLVLLLCTTVPSFGLWKTLKTEAFTVFYPQGRQREAEEILEVLEYYREYVGDLIGAPIRKVAIVLEDVGLQSNGLTDPSFHRILLFRSSPSGGGLGYFQNWWRLVGIHEYTHWGHLSSAEGLPSLLTAVFGNTMVPGNYTPGWLKEGISVVAESGTSPYEGRLNEGLFSAYATVLAQKGALPTIVQATYNMDDFPGYAGPYLFGGQFVDFLLRKFGRQQLSEFFLHYSASIISYLSPILPAVGLDRSARRVFGESIRSLWLEWQLELLKDSVSFKRSEAALTEHGWWLSSPVVWDGGLYYQRSFPLKTASFTTVWQHQLMHLDLNSGRTRVLLRSSAPFSGPMRVHSGTLYYALKEYESGYDNHLYNRFGFTTVLYSRNLEKRRSRRLFKGPFRTFEVLNDGTILTAEDRRDAFGSEIRLHDPVSKSSRLLLVSELLVSDMAADPDELFLCARSDWDNTRIYRVDLPGWSGAGQPLAGVNPGDIRLESLHETPYQEAELCLTENGLYYSATYGAKRALYKYEPDTGMVYRSVASDFARAPAWDGDSGSLYYIGLSERGEDLFRERYQTGGKPVAEEDIVPAGAALPGLRPPGAPPDAELDLPDTAIRRGGYWDNLATLLPRELFPLFTLDPYSSTYQAGAGIAGTSALGDFSYHVLGYYDSHYMRPEIQATLGSSLLAPLQTSISFTIDDRYTLSTTLQWPLHMSLRKGFSYFSLGATAALQWPTPYQTRTLLPFTILGFQGAWAQLYLQTGVQCQHDVDDSEMGYLLRSWIYSSAVFLGAQLSLQANLQYDLQGLYLWSLPWAVPGYENSLSASWGGSFFSTLSIPLLRLRGGLWNPGLFFGDMFLVPFFGFAFNQDNDRQLSYGGTLRLEMKTGAMDEGHPLELYLGWGMTMEGQSLVLLGFEIPGITDGYISSRSGTEAPHPVPR